MNAILRHEDFGENSSPPSDSGKFREYLIIKITLFYSMQVSKYVLVSSTGHNAHSITEP